MQNKVMTTITDANPVIAEVSSDDISNEDDVCLRIEASIQRVVKVSEFSCVIENGKPVLSGLVSSKDEAMMCGVIARMLPGVSGIVNKLKVAR